MTIKAKLQYNVKSDTLSGRDYSSEGNLEEAEVISNEVDQEELQGAEI